MQTGFLSKIRLKTVEAVRAVCYKNVIETFPHIMKKNRAFTLVEILLVAAIIGLIAAVGVPLSSNAIRNARDRRKEVNIARVEAAKKQWAFENNKTNGTSVLWSDISTYMGHAVTHQTNLNVSGETITINVIGTPASY